MYKLISPLYVERNKKGDKEYLNLNNYRNWHYQVSNNLKKKYKEIMAKQISALDYISEPIEITYILYPKTKRLCDVANICCCIDKFFCDALTEMGKISDDNYLYLPKVHYEFGSVDKDNPRCEILIKETHMQVIISLEEMRDAAIQYFNLPADTIVAVDIPDEDKSESHEEVKTTETETQPKKRRRRRRKAEIEADKLNVDLQTPHKSERVSVAGTHNTETGSGSAQESSETTEPVNETIGSDNESQPPFDTVESSTSASDRVADEVKEVKVDDTCTDSMVSTTPESNTPIVAESQVSTEGSLFDAEPIEDQAVDTEMSLIDQVLAEEEEHLEPTPINPSGSLFPEL